MWEYTNKVYDHFRHPKNVGEIKNPDASADVGKHNLRRRALFNFENR